MSSYIIVPKNTHSLFEVATRLKILKKKYRVVPVPEGIKAPCSSAVIVDEFIEGLDGLYLYYMQFKEEERKMEIIQKFSIKTKKFIKNLYNGRFVKNIPQFNEKEKNILYILADRIREQNFGRIFFIFKEEINNEYFKTITLNGFENKGKANLILLENSSPFDAALLRVFYKRSFIGFKWNKEMDYTVFIKKSGINAFIVKNAQTLKNMLEGMGFEIYEN